MTEIIGYSLRSGGVEKQEIRTLPEVSTHPVRIPVRDFFQRAFAEAPIMVVDEDLSPPYIINELSTPLLKDLAVESPLVSGSTPLYLANPARRPLASLATRWLTSMDLFSAQEGSFTQEVLYEIFAGADIDLRPKGNVSTIASKINSSLPTRFFPQWRPKLVYEETDKIYRWMFEKKFYLGNLPRPYRRGCPSSKAPRPLWFELDMGTIKKIPFFSLRWCLPLDRLDEKAQEFIPFHSIDVVQFPLTEEQWRAEGRIGRRVTSWSQITVNLIDENPGLWQGWESGADLYFETGANFPQLFELMEVGKEFNEGAPIAQIEKTARTARQAVAFWDNPQKLTRLDEIIIDRDMPPITKPSGDRIREIMKEINLQSQDASKEEAKAVIKEMMVTLKTNPYLALSIWRLFGVLDNFPAFRKLTENDWEKIEEHLPWCAPPEPDITQEQQYWRFFQSVKRLSQGQFASGWDIFVKALRSLDCLPLELSSPKMASAEVLVNIFDIRGSRDARGNLIELDRPL